MSKVVLITGASSGIGQASAKLLAEGGYVVYGAARRMELLEKLSSSGVRPLRLDVTDERQRAEALARIISEQGRIDVLINNAGFGRYGALEDVPLNGAREQMEVNLYGLVGLVQQVLPHMRAQGEGRIINLSSIAGKMSMPMSAWYHASKHAIEAVSDSLRMEVERFGIEVVIIEPGLIDTPFYETAMRELSKNSGHGPYADYAAGMTEFLRDVITPGSGGQGTPPSYIAEVIAEAVRDDKPKTRYRAGRMADLAVAAQTLLPDRLADSLAKKQMRPSDG